MNWIDEERRATPKEIAEQLWPVFLIQKHPDILADYIELGGDITDEVKAAIIQALRQEEALPHGSSYPWDDYLFFHDVQWSRDGTSLEEAISALAEEKGLTERGAKEKYRRGRRVDLSRQGRDDAD
jgi:hypothetical protein